MPELVRVRTYTALAPPPARAYARAMNPGHVLDGTVLEPRNIPRIRQKLGITALPADGTIGQVLTKLSDADGDVGWATVSGGAGDDTLIWLNL